MTRTFSDVGRELQRVIERRGRGPRSHHGCGGRRIARARKVVPQADRRSYDRLGEQQPPALRARRSGSGRPVSRLRPGILRDTAASERRLVGSAGRIVVELQSISGARHRRTTGQLGAVLDARVEQSRDDVALDRHGLRGAFEAPRESSRWSEVHDHAIQTRRNYDFRRPYLRRISRSRSCGSAVAVRPFTPVIVSAATSALTIASSVA